MVITEIDKKNIMSILKAQGSNLDKEILEKHFVDGGNIRHDGLVEISSSRNTAELLSSIEARFSLANMLTGFMKTHSLIDFELAIDQAITASYVKRLKNVALSIGTIFYFIITAEHEWDNIKRIAYGKRYELPIDRIKSMLLFETGEK